MTKIRGISFKGVKYTGVNLVDIPGAYFYLKPGERTEYRSGVRINSVSSMLNSPTLTVTEGGTGAYYTTIYKNGRPYINNILSTANLINNVKANWKFLHVADSYSIFILFNPDPIPQGTGTQNVRYLLGTKQILGTGAGIAIRLQNSPTNINVIQFSRGGTVDIQSPINAFAFNQDNLLEIRFTKIGATNKFQLFCNGIALGTTTTTTVDNTADSVTFLDLSATVSTSRFYGSFGEIFIVKNTGKTDLQVLEESVIINDYFEKYF